MAAGNQPERHAAALVEAASIRERIRRGAFWGDGLTQAVARVYELERSIAGTGRGSGISADARSSQPPATN